MRSLLLQKSSGELLKSAICDQTARICREHYRNLRAIVLSGSLARDEATFVEGERHWRLLGDADFFLVFDDRLCLPDPRDVESTAKEIKAVLYENGLLAAVGLAAVPASYLRKLPRREMPQLWQTGLR